MSGQPSKPCIFCGIANNRSADQEIQYEDDRFVVIKDIRPHAEHHYLMLTKEHIPDPKHLTTEDGLQLLNDMKTIGSDFMTGKGLTDGRELRMGFHWPPFNSIAHLHLHLLYPTSRLSFLSRIIFKSGSLWFVEINDAIAWVHNKLK